MLTAGVLSSGALFAYHCARGQLALAALHPVALYSGLLLLLLLPVNLLFRARPLARCLAPAPPGSLAGACAAWLPAARACSPVRLHGRMQLRARA